MYVTQTDLINLKRGTTFLVFKNLNVPVLDCLHTEVKENEYTLLCSEFSYHIHSSVVSFILSYLLLCSEFYVEQII